MISAYNSFLVCFLCCCGLSICSQDSIGSRLQQAMLQNTGPHSVCIQLHEEKLLPPSNTLSKDAKGNYVYSSLVNQEAKRGLEVKAFLTELNKPYQSLVIAPVLFTRLSNVEILSISELESVSLLSINEPYMVSDYLDYGDLTEFRDPAAPEWGIQQIEADSVWALGYKGQGIVVAGQDTGYDWEHQALKDKYRGFDPETGGINHRYNWHDAIHEISPLHNDSIFLPENNPCGLDVMFPCDDHGHGTHTMGTMVGSDSLYQMGVAPEAKWIACRSMERGYGTLQTYLECFEWFLAPTDLNGENPQPWVAPDIINNSWACPPMEGCNAGNFEIMNTAIQNLKNAGILVVASAGNSGNNCESIVTPAAIFEPSFTVGATNQLDTLAGFSSRGPVAIDGSFRMKPNVVAPGTQTLSCVLNDGYATFGGTSMSGPHVAGAAALLLSAVPELRGDVDRIEDILEMSATPLFWNGECDAENIPNNLYGYGRINVLKAVELAQTQSGLVEQSPSLSLALYPNPSKEYILFDIQCMQNVFVVSFEGKVVPLLKEGNKILVSHLSEGIYFINATDSQGKHLTGKFFKVD